MTANRGCGWFPETGDQMTFRTPNLLLEPMAEKHLGFMQAEVSKWEVAQRLSSVPHPYPDGGAAEWFQVTVALVFVSAYGVLFSYLIWSGLKSIWSRLTVNSSEQSAD